MIIVRLLYQTKDDTIAGEKLVQVKHNVDIRVASGVPASQVKEPFRPQAFDPSSVQRESLKALYDCKGNGIDELGFKTGERPSVLMSRVDSRSVCATVRVPVRRYHLRGARRARRLVRRRAQRAKRSVTALPMPALHKAQMVTLPSLSSAGFVPASYVEKIKVKAKAKAGGTLPGCWLLESKPIPVWSPTMWLVRLLCWL